MTGLNLGQENKMKIFVDIGVLHMYNLNCRQFDSAR